MFASFAASLAEAGAMTVLDLNLFSAEVSDRPFQALSKYNNGCHHEVAACSMLA